MTRAYLDTDHLRFAVERHGEGPHKALLLHGFPDDAGSMYPLMDRLAERGYETVAPYMRGYGETQSPADANFQISALSADVEALLDALGWDYALVVGHDWGAITAYAASNLIASRISAVVGISVPPLRVFLRNLARHPAQLARSWYMLFFQLPILPERVLTEENFAFIEKLWRDWEPTSALPIGRLAEIKMTFRTGETVESALAYYRGLLRDAPRHPFSWSRSWRLSTEPIPVPTLMITGEDDGCIGPELFEEPGDAFASYWALEILEHVGHFIPTQAPDRVIRAVDTFLRRQRKATARRPI